MNQNPGIVSGGLEVDVIASVLPADAATETTQQRVLFALGSFNTVRIDETDPTLVYVGNAPEGSQDNDSLWQIKRIDTTTPGITIILYPDGNAQNIYSWSQRAVYTYA